MIDYVISAPEVITVPVLGSDGAFPVRRIYCVGRNYAAHVREMGGDERDLPFFFQKPRDAIVLNGGTVPYPPLTEDLQHEVELVLAVGLGGANIVAADAAQHVFGLAVGIDLTRRDVQGEAKKTGRPWEIGKAFDHSAPITAITPLNGAALPEQGRISLSVNDEVRQRGDLSEMIWNCAEVISILSTHYALAPGDLIYTGTPSGVGPVLPGDQLTAVVEGLPDLAISIGEKSWS
ncbi:MAG: fumarylacetoacetate hydrolase family protein [Pseudomonadota bacterium]